MTWEGERGFLYSYRIKLKISGHSKLTAAALGEVNQHDVTINVYTKDLQRKKSPRPRTWDLRHGKLALYERARCMGQECFTRLLDVFPKIAIMLMYTIWERNPAFGLASVGGPTAQRSKWLVLCVRVRAVFYISSFRWPLIQMAIN